MDIEKLSTIKESLIALWLFLIFIIPPPDAGSVGHLHLSAVAELTDWANFSVSIAP